MRNFILAALFFLVQGNVFAHAIWIETNPTGKSNKAQRVSVYFGEYSENERDSAGHWFSDLGQFKLWVTAPDGAKIELKTTANGNAYTVDFTPKTKGVYTFSIDHVVADVYYHSMIHYYALASTVIDNDAVKGSEYLSQATDFSVKLTLDKPFTVDQPIEVDVLFPEKEVGKSTFSVQPPLGWTKEFKLNEKGHTFFKPFIEGRYMLEGFYTDETPGTHNGKEYTAVWHCVTYCVEAKK